MASVDIGIRQLVQDSINRLNDIKQVSNDDTKIKIEELVEYYKKYEEQFKDSTQERNTSKERFNSSELKTALKINDLEVIKMRKDGLSNYRIAKKLDVTSAAIHYRIINIINGMYKDGVSIEDIGNTLKLSVYEVKSKIK